MCPPQAPRRSSSLPLPRPSPRVCTLHVVDVLMRNHQDTPKGPTAEARSGREVLTITGRSRRILSLQLRPQLPAGALVLIQPTVRSLLGDNPILQEVQANGSLSVLTDNLETTEFDLAPHTIIGSV